MFGILNLLVPVAIKIVESYITSSSSKKDDEVLNVVRTGADYLVNKQADIVPFAVDVINRYTKNTSSKNDDKVLDIVKNGVRYLASKDNNSLSQVESNMMDKIIMYGK